MIGLVMVAMVAHLGGLRLQHELVRVLVLGCLPAGSLPAAAARLFGGLATAAQVLGMLVALAACTLLGWVIAQLRSEVVRQ